MPQPQRFELHGSLDAVDTIGFDADPDLDGTLTLVRRHKIGVPKGLMAGIKIPPATEDIFCEVEMAADITDLPLLRAFDVRPALPEYSECALGQVVGDIIGPLDSPLGTKPPAASDDAQAALPLDAGSSEQARHVAAALAGAALTLLTGNDSLPVVHRKVQDIAATLETMMSA